MSFSKVQMITQELDTMFITPKAITKRCILDKDFQ